MADGFDQIQITVPDLDSARADYALLLDSRPANRTIEGVAESCFALANTVLTLRQGAVETAEVAGLVLRDPDAGAALETRSNPLGLSVSVCDGSQSDALGERRTSLAVDHLVLRTDSAQRCIDFFAEEMGIRLALDKTVPEWGGRMLFFRAGKMTLEVIESDKEAVAGSHFWGIALQTDDLPALCQRLDNARVLHSEIRDGRKPGTRVATVKSHCLDLPTLLIEPVQQQ